MYAPYISTIYMLDIHNIITAKEKPPINVVGDVSGRIAIMVDDMIDDVQSFVDAASVLKERGAYKIYVFATHGILSKEAPRLLEESEIDEVNILLRVVLSLVKNLGNNLRSFKQDNIYQNFLNIHRLWLPIPFLMMCKNYSAIKSKLWIFQFYWQKQFEGFITKNPCRIYFVMFAWKIEIVIFIIYSVIIT